jgi:lipopolysaccharide export system permease protein
MTVAQRHMFRRVLGETAGLSVALCLIILLLGTQSLLYLLAERAISLKLFLQAVILLAPDPIYRGVPFAIAIAIVHAYLKWGRNNEIVSLRMAGMSDLSLAVPGLATALVATVFAASTSLYLLPIAFRSFEDIRYTAKFNLSLGLLDQGYLQQIAPNISISFRRRLSGSEIGGVTILDSRKQGEVKYLLADRARLQNPENPDGQRLLVLLHGSYQIRRGSEERLAPVAFQELTLPIADSADGSSRVREWHGFYEESIGTLLDPPSEVREDPELYGNYVAEGHMRVATPLSCLTGALFALGVMLNAKYERRSAPLKSIVAALTGVALWQSLLIGGHALISRVPAFAPLIYVLCALPAVIGALLLASRPARARAARRLSGVPAPMAAAD